MSTEINDLQSKLLVNVDRFNEAVAASTFHDRLRSNQRTPIKFVVIGSDADAIEAASRLMDKGFYVNMTAYPAVARGKAGVRIVMNASQTTDDVEMLVEAIECTLNEMNQPQM